jgi:hypothetical protein
MHVANYCAECGARMKRKGWRAWLNGNLCEDCARRFGKTSFGRPLVVIAIIVIAAFALGRSLRPGASPLVIERAANSPLSDLPVNLNDTAKSASLTSSQNGTQQTSDDRSARQTANAGSADDVIYLCGARTQKGTPCHRRVHFAGERCYQHKGKPAILPPEKLIVKS